MKTCLHCFNIDSCSFMKNADGSRLICNGKDEKCSGYIVDEELTSKPKEARMAVKKKAAKKAAKKAVKKKAVAKKPAKKATKKVAVKKKVATKKVAAPVAAELH